MDKKKLFLWSLYDFANSIVFISFLLYFSQWLVVERGLSDFWYNVIFALATVLLFLSAPVLASITDKHGGRKFFLNIATIGTFVSYLLAALLAIYSPQNIFVIAMFFLFGEYFYQLSFIFYHPMLEEIADRDHRARASGIGQFSNALGQVTGVLAALPFSSSRLAPLLPSIIIFFILALPMMIFFKSGRRFEYSVKIKTIKEETRTFWKKFMSFFSLSLAAPMLIAYFFFNDALITVSNNYSIYMERVFILPDKVKSLLLVLILAMSALGSIAAGWVGDRIGLLRTLKFILLGWIVALPLIAVTPNIAVLAVISGITGLLIGSVWTITRAYITTLLTREEMGYGFSFYTMFERFATFLGPLVWGGTILFLGTAASSYRIAVASMTLFVLIGFLILHFWKRAPKML